MRGPGGVAGGFAVSTDERTQVVDVTDDVDAALLPDATGTATVSVRHMTAGIAVQEAEPRLLTDVDRALDRCRLPTAVGLRGRVSTLAPRRPRAGQSAVTRSP